MKKINLPILVAALLTLMGAWNVIAADQAPTEVISVDPADSTVTISANGKTTTYHLDPLGTVYKNGQKASLKDLGPGMLVSSVSLSDPTTLSELRVSEPAQPASGADSDGIHYGSSLPADELKELMGKVGNSYWNTGPDNWIYLAPDGKLVDTPHERWLGRWTLTDRYTLLLIDDAMQNSGKQRPTLLKLNASYTIAGPWTRQPLPGQAIKDKVARLNP